MVFNGVIGANCISKIFRDRLFDNIKDDAENDLQLSVLLDTLEKLPDCSKLMEDGEKPFEPGKIQNEKGELVEAPKKEKKLSKYNLFVRKCMEDKNNNFSSCGVLWKDEKAKGVVV